MELIIFSPSLIFFGSYFIYNPTYDDIDTDVHLAIDNI